MGILALGLLLAALMIFATLLLYLRRWSVGQRAKVDWLAGLRRLPRAYLHDVHDVVAREQLAGGMHALTAGGLLASLLLLLLLAWIGWRGALPGLLLLAALACLIAGSLLVARRRSPSCCCSFRSPPPPSASPRSDSSPRTRREIRPARS